MSYRANGRQRLLSHLVLAGQHVADDDGQFGVIQPPLEDFGQLGIDLAGDHAGGTGEDVLGQLSLIQKRLSIKRFELAIDASIQLATMEMKKQLAEELQER